MKGEAERAESEKESDRCVFQSVMTNSVGRSMRIRTRDDIYEGQGQGNGSDDVF